MPETRPNLLFVCIENSNRSQMAEGFARTLGKGRVSAFSAGSRPAGQINPRAVQFMKEEGIDLTVQLSKGLDDLPKIRWDWIVTMGCGDACPMLPAAHRLDWERSKKLLAPSLRHPFPHRLPPCR
jgi:arsenate reductase